MIHQQPTLIEQSAPDGARSGVDASVADLHFLNLYQVYRRTLSADEDCCLRLVEQRGLKYSEAAEVLGTTADRVCRLVFTARRKLLCGMERTLKDLDEERQVPSVGSPQLNLRS